MEYVLKLAQSDEIMIKRVKYFTGIIIQNDNDLWDNIKGKLQEYFGNIDIESVRIPFDFTNYYSSEMGEGLIRFWVSYEDLYPPGNLPDWKLKCIQIETLFSDKNNRRVNIDPGYMELAKIVLSSGKNYSHRIYLDKNVFCELEYRYSNGHFHFLPWTYPDYKTSEAITFFKRMREKYKIALDKL